MLTNAKKRKSKRSIPEWINDKSPMKYGNYSKMKTLQKAECLRVLDLFKSEEFYIKQNKKEDTND